MAEYNRAQFELFHALGYPAREVTSLRPPAKLCRWTRRGRIPASGGQRPAAGNPMSGSRQRMRRMWIPVFSGRSGLHPCVNAGSGNLVPGSSDLEAKQLLSTGPSTSPLGNHGARPPSRPIRRVPCGRRRHSESRETVTPWAIHSKRAHSPRRRNQPPDTSCTASPTRTGSTTTCPPFTQVLVQDQQPVPGQTYNVLYVVVRNGTAKTFDASSGFAVKAPSSNPTRSRFSRETSNGSRGSRWSSTF